MLAIPRNTSTEDGVSSPKPNYTLGRGKVLIDGRYIGNTPYLRVTYDAGTYRLAFGAEDITMENLEMFMGGARCRKIEYVAANPLGKLIGFTVERARVGPNSFDVKSENFQVLDFLAVIQSDRKSKAALVWELQED